MPAAGPPDSTPDQAQVSRRGVLGVLGFGGWAATVLVADPASAAGLVASGAVPRPRDPLSAVDDQLASIPRTLAATFRGTGPATPRFGPGYVAVRWHGPTGGGQAGPAIRLRVPDGTFGAWSPLSVGCPAERDDRAGGTTPEHAVLVSVRPGARSACFELRMPPGVSAVESTALNTTSGPIQRVRVPTVTAQDALAAVAGLARTIEALSGGPSPSGPGPGPLSAPLPARSGSAPATSSPRPTRLAAAVEPTIVPVPPAQVPAQLSPVPSPPALPAGPLPLRYLPRAAWGADETLRLNPATGQPWQPSYHPGQVITVHHTVTPNVDPDPAATVRAVYHFHTVDRGWADIGYHFLIDQVGTLYEGRWSGTDGIPAHRPDGQVVTGAHVGGFNAGNIGVALLGDLRTQPPTAAARRSLALVLLALTGAHQLNPLGRVAYVNPASAARRDVPSIGGHRDWMATECPGGSLYAMLPGVRLDVSRSLV